MYYCGRRSGIGLRVRSNNNTRPATTLRDRIIDRETYRAFIQEHVEKVC